jgi:ribonuclease HI
MPLRAMKGQIVSDFIVDHAVVESPQLQVELKPWRLFFDGSTHKDGSGVGIMIISPDGIPTKLKYRIEGPLCSNNEAEYEALIAGLEALLEFRATRVEIKGDSELVIKQLTKEYKCIKENLIMYFVIANRLLNFFEYIDIKHVPRIKNQEANDLAQITSGYRISKEKLEELVEVRGKEMAARLSPTDLESTQLGYANKEEFEVLAIDTLMDSDWRNPIINYLKDPSIDTERKTK